MSFSLKLFGGAALEGAQGPVSGPAVQRHRLALLALLAGTRSRSVGRERVMAFLWPERESDPARRLLNQSVHALRHELGADAILSVGEDLQLNPAIVRSDVAAFEEALGRGDNDAAVALYTGPFLDGFFLDDAPEFEQWAQTERDRLANARAKAIESLAERAERAGESARATEWWRARAAHDPYDTRVAIRLMQAMERAGNRAGALQHGGTHQRLLRDELGIERVPEVDELVARLRADGQAGPRADWHAREPDGEVPATSFREVASPAIPSRSPGAVDMAGGDASRSRTVLAAAAIVIVAALIAGGSLLGGPRRGTNEPTVQPASIDAIAQAVARELELRQRGDTSPRTPAHRTANIAAYELYLRGTDPTLTRSDSGVQRGLEYFRRAVALDSNYAAAWAGLARMTMRSSGNVPAVRRQTRDSAEALVRKSLALDDSVAEAHAILAVLRLRAYDFAGAERHFTRALALEPNHARNREWYAKFYLMEARPADALAEATRTLSLAPLSPTANAEYAHALLVNDRCAEALPRLESLKDVHPPLLRVGAITAACLMKLGRWNEALALIGSDNDPYSMALRGYSLARMGRADQARRIQDSLRTLWQLDSIGAYLLAFIPAGERNRTEAFRWIERSADDMSLGYFPGISLATAGPPLDELRDDPRMVRILDRLRNQNR